MASNDLLTRVRLQVMETARDTCRLPNAREVGQALNVPADTVVDAYRQLHDGHVFVLEPGTSDQLRMANPFSGVPTPFWVQMGDRAWWGNCIWDGLGIIAALGGNGTLATTCPDCGHPQAVSVRDSTIVDGSGVAYIGVPARAWWENIIYT